MWHSHAVLIDHWPIADLRLAIGDLELRLPTPDELGALATVAANGVHPSDSRPFLNPWTDAAPAERARLVVQRHWRRLGDWTPQDWRLDLAVFLDGEPVGVQDMGARDFAVRREVTTGSWLGLPYHRRGIGTAMRWATLSLAFDGLGAGDATSMSFLDNLSSLGVSRRLGYRDDGISRDARGEEVLVSQRLRLTRDDWAALDRPEVTITGLNTAALRLFGADGTAATATP
ncbi:GNAT family N-acetyltransferase [Stackebrandtia soli]|uniref:GNAT family N-acetyltransferase n=1 Tax=Stackebrandtia soli TaxID=1892856 RepID=UPI0039E78390